MLKFVRTFAMFIVGSRKVIHKPTQLILSAVAALAVMCIGAIFVVADHYATQRAVNAEVARAQASAGLLASGFRRELEKFRLASVVLAQDPDAKSSLTNHDPQTRGALNQKLEALNSEMAAAAIYVMDTSGNTIVASNWRQPTTFVGSSYAFRAYFREAMRSGKFEQFALGSVSRRPGLYVAKRIDVEGQPLGVVVIKVEFDGLEAEWKRSGSPVFATNQKGVILVTNVPAWRFQTTGKLPDDDQKRILSNIEFGHRPLKVNSLFAAEKVAVAGSPNALKRPFVEVIQSVSDLWSVHVLTSTKAAIDAAVTLVRLVVLIVLLTMAGLIALVLYRNKTHSLRGERLIAERLRAMNDRLVQANKLAAIGQIAAGVGHEINQPLAAIGSYTDNSIAYLDAGNVEAAQQNLERIALLIHRVGAITGELRGFARKATGITSAVSISDAIDGALLLLRDRINTLGAQISVEPKSSRFLVIAEGVRLEQVLVNLLQNALDAGGNGVWINIIMKRLDERLEVTIADNGLGLSDNARAALFQPFSTSKREGLGLGLVISRDIMADFGGELIAGNPKSGAAFIMRLKCAV